MYHNFDFGTSYWRLLQTCYLIVIFVWRPDIIVSEVNEQILVQLFFTSRIELHVVGHLSLLLYFVYLQACITFCWLWSFCSKFASERPPRISSLHFWDWGEELIWYRIILLTWKYVVATSFYLWKRWISSWWLQMTALLNLSELKGRAFMNAFWGVTDLFYFSQISDF